MTYTNESGAILDSLGRFIAIVLAIVLILLYPLQYVAGSQIETMDHMMEHYTAQFTDTVRKGGNITLEIYEEYIGKISLTGELYDIGIEHASPKTSGDIISENTLSNVLFASNKNNFLPVSEINSSVGLGGMIRPFAAHTHIDACYDGNKHAHSGNSSSGGGCYGNRTIDEEYCGEFTGREYEENTYLMECDSCGYSSTGQVDYGGSTHYDCGAGWGVGTLSSSIINSRTYYQCTGCSDVSSTYGYTHYKTVTVYDLNCGKTAGSYYNTSGNLVSPICHTVVTSIAGTNQTITEGGNISTTATATYLNGTTGTVNCIATGFNKNQVGTQIVTLTYSGKVGNAKTMGTIATTITVVVQANLQSLTVVPSTTTVYNGSEPTYTVKAHYGNGTSKTLASSQYTKTGWSSGAGTKTVSFTYIENGKTVTASITITVKPNITGITVTPSTQSIERYQNPSFTVRVNYENGTSTITTVYTMTGFNNKDLGTQTPTFAYTENGITKTTTAKVTVTKMTKVCSVCGTRYQLDNNDVDNGCPACISTIDYITVSPDNITLYQGDSLPITVTAAYRNGKRAVITGWTSNYNSMKIGIQNIIITYQGHKAYLTVQILSKVKTCPVCNETYPLNPDGTDDGCPYCRVELVKIEVQPKAVTVNTHQPLPITVTAFYRDGHTEVVYDWSTNFIPDRAGEYSVTITYKSVSEVIKVIVEDNDIIACFYCGENYNKRENPYGCPICATTIIGIEAKLRSEGNKVLQGSDLNLEIILIFRDKHREIMYTGYTVSNYFPNQLGEQTVTVHYGEYSTLLTIEIIPMLNTNICPNGHEYYLNADGSDPGCPYCHQSIGEKSILYYEITYTGEILDALYQQGYYDMKEGDYITVIVTSRNTSLRARIQKMFTPIVYHNKKVIFGGEVNNGSSY